MVWPTVAVATTNCDAGTDVPATFRTDVLDAITKQNQMIAHVSAFAATLLDDAAAATARATLGAAASGANADITSMTALTSINGGPIAGFRNIVINGGFTINQRVYVSAAVLASGLYGHDRWKAGTGGGDYSFTQLESDTTITIAANKTLIQAIENKNVQATSYLLSWTGTAQARVGLNSATPSGAYAASPILITGQTVGTVMSVEFGNGAASGTLGKVQLERGTATAQATSFEQRPFQVELSMCQRYFSLVELVYGPTDTSVSTRYDGVDFTGEMRVAPTFGTRTTIEADTNITGVSVSNITVRGARINITPTAAAFTFLHSSWPCSAEL